MKLQAVRPATLLKRDSNTVVFLWILWNFPEHLFWRISENGCFSFVDVVTSISMCLTGNFHFFGRFSTILLVRHFLYLNVTFAKVLVRYEIFAIRCFATFSLANMLSTFHVDSHVPLKDLKTSSSVIKLFRF